MDAEASTSLGKCSSVNTRQIPAMAASTSSGVRHVGSAQASTQPAANAVKA